MPLGAWTPLSIRPAGNAHLLPVPPPLRVRRYCDTDGPVGPRLTQVGRDLYTALVQFFRLFPRLQGRQFFITGESYAGKYVPALGHAIHHSNPTAAPADRINLQVGLLGAQHRADPPGGHSIMLPSRALRVCFPL